MKTLVLGADGMLGHRTVQTFALGGSEVVSVTRRSSPSPRFDGLNVTHVGGVDGRIISSVARVVADHRPGVIVNAVGIVKQRTTSVEELIALNSLLPHQLATVARAAGARLVHVSTDCVFSGSKGGYCETDMPDPVDSYGVSKLLGEIPASDALTLRTSIVGLELHRATGLVEWYLRQGGTVPGWDAAIFSGLTTSALSRLIFQIATEAPEMSGLWHVSSDPISKFDLLSKIHDRLRGSPGVVADTSVRIDRSLDSTRLRKYLHYEPPGWDEMLDELVEEILARGALPEGLP